MQDTDLLASGGLIDAETAKSDEVILWDDFAYTSPIQPTSSVSTKKQISLITLVKSRELASDLSLYGMSA